VGVSNGVSYEYQVTAVNDAGESAKSNSATAQPVGTPRPPTTLTARSVINRGVGMVALNWSAAPSATSYRVYRSLVPSGQGAKSLALGVTGTAFVDASAHFGVTYYYIVRASNVHGIGSPS